MKGVSTIRVAGHITILYRIPVLAAQCVFVSLGHLRPSHYVLRWTRRERFKLSMYMYGIF